jgi:hypothetical protein
MINETGSRPHLATLAVLPHDDEAHFARTQLYALRAFAQLVRGFNDLLHHRTAIAQALKDLGLEVFTHSRQPLGPAPGS